MSNVSNHPRIVINNIPIGINKRLTSISSNEEVFNTEKKVYQDALNEAGFNYQLGYHNNHKKKRIIGYNQNRNGQNKNNNRRNVIFFNPPFNLYCASNVGRIFRDLVNKHFSYGNDLGKLFLLFKSLFETYIIKCLSINYYVEM